MDDGLSFRYARCKNFAERVSNKIIFYTAVKTTVLKKEENIMKGKYLKPVLSFLSFNESDVLTTSPVNGFNDENNYITDPDSKGGFIL